MKCIVLVSVLMAACGTLAEVLPERPRFQLNITAKPEIEKDAPTDEQNKILEGKMLQELQELKKFVKGLNTEACCTDYTFVPTYERCADCHYASWYKPRLNETTSKVICQRLDNKDLRDNERDACGIFEHHDRLVEEIRCTGCKYVMRVDGTKNQKAELDTKSCKCSVVKGEVRFGSLFRESPGPGPNGSIITLEDSRGNPVSAGAGREWTSIPQFRVATDAKRLRNGFQTEEVINMVCDNLEDMSTCRAEISLVKTKASKG